jgi:hypothetical protein
MAYGPEAGLALLDQMEGLPAPSGDHLLPSVRATCRTSSAGEMRQDRSCASGGDDPERA